ncbi:peptidylprolyl isomerase [Nocardia sp. NPDC057353]|uniref:peptidylprolyl isomerase n=1 Tax=Nocardia sp. NPDC057353 TaxID=3346104 RepID=UPI0036385F7B
MSCVPPPVSTPTSRPAPGRPRLRAALLAAPLLAALIGAAPVQAIPIPGIPALCAPPGPGTPTGQQWQAEPPLTIEPAAYIATLNTTCGPLTLELDGAAAPRTVNSFAFLAEQKYFDHTACHRLTTDGIFVLQCGDPTASGTGGPGYRLPDENLAGAVYPAGTVAMANAGPGTNGSQFFLVYRDSQLPPNYTPFGRVTAGLELLNGIAAAGVLGGGDDGGPAVPVVLNSVTVAKA